MEISRQGRIDDLGKLLLGAQGVEQSTGQKVDAPAAKEQDRVEISAAGKELQRVRELTRSEETFRNEKVEQLRQAVESGRYDVTGRTVADRLIRHTLIESVL